VRAAATRLCRFRPTSFDVWVERTFGRVTRDSAPNEIGRKAMLTMIAVFCFVLLTLTVVLVPRLDAIDR
jgi:hypothetical protein